MLLGKENLLRGVFIITVTLAMILLWGTAEPMEIKDGVYILTASPGVPSVHKIMAPTFTTFAQNVEKNSNGRVKIKFVWGDGLHTLTQGFDAVAKNVTDMTYTQPMYVAGDLYLSQFSALPYTFANGVIGALVSEELYPKYFKPEFERRGVKLLWWTSTGNYQFFTRQPIQTVQDLRGIKIRSGGMIQNDILRRLGVVPVSIASPEIYNALQTKVIDGVFYTLGAAASYKYYEVIRHITLTNFSQIAVPASINPRTLASLPQDIQDIIYREARLTGIRGSMLYYDEDAKAIDEFKQHGTKVDAVSPQVEGEIKKLVEPVWQKFIEDNEKRGLPAKQMVADLEALREKYKKMSFQEILERQRTNPVQGIW